MFFFMFDYPPRLEEEVAVVLHVSLQVELVHETAGSLHSLLLQLAILRGSIETPSRAFLLSTWKR